MPLASDGPWDLPIHGYEVLAVTFAYPLDIVVYADGGASCLIRLSGRFDLKEATQPSHALDASSDRWQDLTSVLGLRHDRIKAARVSVGGELVVEFASGSAIEAGTDDRYENWDVTGPDFKLVALPGGGVGVW